MFFAVHVYKHACEQLDALYYPRPFTTMLMTGMPSLTTSMMNAPTTAPTILQTPPDADARPIKQAAIPSSYIGTRFWSAAVQMCGENQAGQRSE
ncbi:hypothetical protein [Paraburkholderia nemoris]|uniref:hypothetical protein n=1 Tax=Paraburkholderia nemoris TaxID=2793076 RepID=UPI001F35C1FD|nr:hypothetical protein [Paraburkholderia nemoris]